MLGWFAEHSDVLTVFTNIGTLIIWLVYAQLLYFSFRRQRRPRLIINRGSSKDINALCIISNMSAESVFIEYIIAELETSRGKITLDVTDYEQARNEDGAEENSSSQALEPSGIRVDAHTNQGPLASGGYLHLGSFDELIQRMAREAGIEMDGHRPKGDLTFKQLNIRLIGIYGSEDAPIGAQRSFNLIDKEHECSLVPMSWDTKRLASRKQRHILRREVAQLNDENFSSSSSVRLED